MLDLRLITDKAKHRGQFSIVFSMCGYILLRVSLAKAAAYPIGAHIPAIIILGFIAGTALGTVGLVYWVLTCRSVYKAIQPIRDSGQDIGWGLLVICVILGPLGALICGGFISHQYQRKSR